MSTEELKSAIASIDEGAIILSSKTKADYEFENWFLYRSVNPMLDIKVLRGRKMREYQLFMNEIAAALQFPAVFGENWDALRECLELMYERSNSDGIAVFVDDAAEVLVSEEDRELVAFLRVVDETGRKYAAAITDNGHYNRPATPFHFVFQEQEENYLTLKNRFLQAGIPFRQM